MPFKDEKTRRAFFAGLAAKKKQLGKESEEAKKAETAFEKAIKKTMTSTKKPKASKLKKIKSVLKTGDKK